MKNQLLSSAFKAFAIVAVVIVFCFIIFVPPRFVFLHVTTAATSGKTSEKIKVRIKNLLWPGRYPPSLGNFYLFAIAGRGSILIWGSGYETAEIEVGSTGEIFRGDITHHSLASIFHRVHVTLVPKDKNLKIKKYTGFLTTEDKNSPEVLAIHPSYHSAHVPLKWLLRRHANIGKDISTLSYIMLTAVRDRNKNSLRYMLDFSHANGGVQEFIPPLNWPTGDCYRRLLYSLNGEAPLRGYKKFLSLPSSQDATPYKIGIIPFHCIIDGHYGAGIVGIHSPAYIKIWVNRKKSDQTLRYIY